MPGVKINFAEVESSFEPLPEGAYECVVESVEVRESNSSDNDYLNWELKVLDEEFQDRRLWMITSLGEKALWKLKDVLMSLGVIEEDDELDIDWEDDVDITPKEGPRLISPVVEGIPCVAIVYHEMYEGRTQTRVREVAESNGGGSSPAKKAPAKKAPAKRSAAKKTAAKKPAASKTSGTRKSSSSRSKPAASRSRSRSLR